MRQAKFYFLILMILSCGIFETFAQNSKDNELKKESSRTISGGVINGKATNLVKPPYPAAARAVRASGAVNVQVTIDENGNVISATAVSGHPLLRAAAVQAARQSTFSPTYLEGKPVKVTGIIVYNFILEMTFLQIGYEISLAENSATFPQNFPTANISGNLPKEWEDEKSDLDALSSYLFAKRYEAENAARNDSNESKNQSKASLYKSTAPIGRVSGKTIQTPAKTVSNPKEFVKNLGTKIENRLRNEELTVWYFGLGQILGKIDAEIEHYNKTLANINLLESYLLNVPLGVDSATVSNAREILEIFNQSTFDEEKKQKIQARILALKNSRSAK